MSFKVFFCTLCLSISLLFTGCTSFQPTTKTSQNIHDAHHSPSNQLLDHRWALEGKLAVHTPDENVSIFIRWQQIDESFRIDLKGPLGQGSAQIMSRPDQGARLISTKENIYASNAEALFEQHFGWFFPVSHLKYWVAGRPHPTAEPIFFSQASFPHQAEAERQYSEFQQDNWQIKVNEYATMGELHTPKKISLVYPANAKAHEIKLKFAIKKWDVDFPN